MSLRLTDVKELIQAPYGEIKEGIERMGQAFEVFKQTNDERLESMKKENLSLTDRLEALEAKGASPGRTGGGRRDIPWREFHTEHGKVIELPYNVKMADALPPEKEPEIPLERWLPAALLGEKCRDKKAVEYALSKKQMVTSTSGVLIPEEFQSQWIDLVRSKMVLSASGMTTVTMDAKTQTHSAVMTDPAVTWHTEAGTIDVGNPTFALRQLIAKTAVVRCQGSVELSQDSPNFGAQLLAVMTRAIAEEVDRVGLIGAGTAIEPQGIFGTSNIGTVAAVGTPTDYSEILTAVQKLLEANIPLEVATANVIMSPRTWATYEGLVTGLTGDLTQLVRPRALRDSAFRVTTAVPNVFPIGSPPGNESLIFLGDFSNLLLGTRRESAVEALKLQTYATNLLLEFIAFTRVDFVVTRPSAFVVMSGVTA